MKKEEFSFWLKTTDGEANLTMVIDYTFPYSVLGKFLDKLLTRMMFDRPIMNGAKKTKE